MLAFKHPILEELYKKDFFIDEAILKDIIALGDEVVPDLQMIVESEIDQFGEIKEKDWFENFAMLHAVYLLYDIDATQAYGIVLKLASQDAYFMEYWFSDWVFEDVPELLTKLGRNNTSAYIDFLNNKAYSLESKSLVANSLTSIAVLNPLERPEIVAFLKQHLQFFIDHKDEVEELFPKDKGADEGYGYDVYEYLSFLLAEIQDKGLVELKEEVDSCLTNELNDPFIINMDEEDRFEEEPKIALTESIFVRYESFKHLFGEDSPYHPDADKIRVRKAKEHTNRVMNQQASLPKVAEAKIGRNDSCPCGSGKKYKKCCME